MQAKSEVYPCVIEFLARHDVVDPSWSRLLMLYRKMCACRSWRFVMIKATSHISEAFAWCSCLSTSGDITPASFFQNEYCNIHFTTATNTPYPYNPNRCFPGLTYCTNGAVTFIMELSFGSWNSRSPWGTRCYFESPNIMNTDLA